jgi:hypothetical protein
MPRSRPERLEAVKAEVQALRGEYARWFDALPESLQDTSLAELLESAINQLDEVYEALDCVELPRGFGRD